MSSLFQCACEKYGLKADIFISVSVAARRFMSIMPAVPSYAKLYKLTKNEHYLDVARILLHGTKAMLALPGRTYDMLGPGWQQEHWRMGPGTRGVGAHRDWLPWVSVNHIHGIVGLELLDKDIYQQLAKGN